MKTLLLTFLLASMISIVCDAKGRVDSLKYRTDGPWSSELNWKQVRQKAKNERKFIFIDVYATWCGPCKKMEHETFGNDSVKKKLADKFVSVRMQYDTTMFDSFNIKDWHAVSDSFSRLYHITSFPTYIFFDADGNVIHKQVGFKNSSEFQTMLLDISNPDKQFYTNLKKVDSNTLQRKQSIELAKYASEVGDKDLANRIAKYFIDHFAYKFSDLSEMTTQEWEFINSYRECVNSSDALFKWCIDRAKQSVDKNEVSVYNKIVDGVIYKEEVEEPIKQFVQNGIEPDWVKIENAIIEKYGNERVKSKIIYAKMLWYKKHNWVLYTKCIITRFEITGLAKVPTTLEGTFFINNSAWEVFKFADVKENAAELQKALIWINKAIEIDSIGTFPASFTVEHIDTKANILYKLGRVSEAIIVEERAVETCRIGGFKDKEMQFFETVKKFRNSIPTWPTNQPF